MIIVDTNVIIDIERGKQSLKAIFEEYPNEEYCLSMISVMELFTGLGYSRQIKGDNFYEKQKKKLETIIADFELIPLSLEIVKNAGLRRGLLMNQGNIIDNEDIIIGISAEILKVSHLITRNKKHFDPFSFPILEYQI